MTRARTCYSVAEALRLKVAKKLAEQAGDRFSDGRAYWLRCADEIMAQGSTTRGPDMGDVWAMLARSYARNNRKAIAAAARHGGDVKQAPAESPQSGGKAASPKG